VRARVWTLVGGGIALVALSTVAGLVLATRGGSEPARVAISTQPPASTNGGNGRIHGLPASNLRVLSGAQTRRLLSYATAVGTCLDKHAVDVSGPTKEARTITLEIGTKVAVSRLLRLVLSCADPLGAPPSSSSLQVVDARTVVVSVPKQCLLDPKVKAPKTRV
jgi:hypothetical protein